ncbi:hypothetical protein [Alkaliphilus hydrothermalis]|uniref:Uncharacterized protein n=1 Tax=Alkaliphilus hydrothermalis TaxID=1482730 RepID=A0ABS2NM21_9FIRM|nr:hypothetical protein [Alkaliphilus hydrothermalis]MBM7613926.1 hypothetical protein [Alkaliphilus hydrothermalis]
MQLPSPQHYLMKTKTNFAFYFHLKKDRSIAVKSYDDKNRFLEEEVVVSQPVLDFSVTIDRNDYLHLICITSEGVLSYYIRSNSQWNHRQISKVDIKSNVYRNLVLMIKNKDTHILCNKTNFTNPAITSIEHMYWNNKGMKKVTVTTYLPGKYSNPFQVDIDSVGNLHLIYKVLHHKNNQLYYSFYSIFNKKWNNGEIISSLQEDHSHPHMLIDKQDNLHLVWCTIEDNNFTLKYKRKMKISSLKSKWSPQKSLSDKNANNYSPLLIHEGSVLKVLNRQNDRFNEVISEDFGENWINSFQSQRFNGQELTLIKYGTNSDLEKINTSISKIYGEIGDYISIIGTNLFAVSTPPPQPQSQLNNHQEELLKRKNEDKELPKQIKEEVSNEIPRVISNEAIHEPQNPFGDTISKTPNEPTKESDKDSIKDTVQDAIVELPQGIQMDENLKSLVQEVQNYINRMVIEVEKIEESKKVLQDKASQPPKDFSNSQTFQQFQSNLINLNSQLTSIEAEEFELQKELDQFQKKIYAIEDRMIQFKKQLLEMEDKVMKFPSLQSSLVNRFKSIFK